MNKAKLRRSLFGGVAAIAVVVALSGCQSDNQETEGVTPSDPTTLSKTAQPLSPAELSAPPPSAETKPIIPIPPPAEATLVAVGDIMMHTPQLPGAYDAKTKSYDFSGFFNPVRSLLSDANWTFGNLETPIAGDERGFRGYPRFNAPTALADALADAGFDVLSTANNHSMDQGFDGLSHTIKILTEKGLHSVGTYDSEAASHKILMMEHNGIQAAFLAYTYGTNGIPVPKDKPYAVKHIDPIRIASDIQSARESGADFIAVSLHFGNEYQRQPSELQKKTAHATAQAGADLIIGHHPHVVQPYEWVTMKQQDGRERRSLIMYSLGNFISNQFGGFKEYGAILKVIIRKTYQPDGTAELVIAEADVIPTWVHKYVSGGKSRYRILSLDTIAQDKQDPLLTPRLYEMLRKQADVMNNHVDSFVVAADGKAATVTRSVYH